MECHEKRHQCNTIQYNTILCNYNNIIIDICTHAIDAIFDADQVFSTIMIIIMILPVVTRVLLDVSILTMNDDEALTVAVQV